MKSLKKAAISTLILLVSFSLPGCSFLKDKNSKVNEPRALKMGQTACLADTKKILLDYLDGTETVERVEEMVDCLVKAVDSFTARTSGENSADGYTLDEIKRFIIDYFADENSFSVKLLSIGFEIKATAIGGRSNNITRIEIEKVKQILLAIKAGVRELDPNMDILLGRLKPSDDVSVERIDKAVHALNTFTEKISTRFQDSDGSSLPIQRIFDLVKSMRKASSDPDEEERALKRLENYPTLAENLKSILISGPKDKVLCSEWTTVLKTAAKMYGILIRYRFGLEDRKMGEGDTAKVVAGISSDLVTLLRQGASRNENKMIAADGLRQLILNYEKIQGQLPLDLKSASLAPIFPKIFTNVLRPSRIKIFKYDTAAEKNRPLGIGDLEISSLQYYVQNWIYGMVLSRELFKSRDSRTAADLVAQLKDMLKSVQASKPTSSSEIFKANVKAMVIREFIVVLDPTKRAILNVEIDAPPPAEPKNPADAKTPAEKLKAPLIGGDSRDAEYRAEDLIQLNTTRVIVEIVLRSFSLDPNRAREVHGLTADEAESLYRDMRKIGFDMDVADPRSQRAGYRTFMEANLFMSNSDGDDYINYREGVEWFNFVSASGKHALGIFESARKDSLKTVPKNSVVPEDIFGRKKVDITSFRKHFKANFGLYFSNIPGMAGYVEELKRQNQYQAFEISLENASRPLGHSNHRMDSSAMRTIVPIIYYTESIFNRYDTDKSGVLENDEAWEIFPIMKNTIQDVSNGAADAEWKQKMVFARLLLTGEPPPDDWRKYLSTPIDYLKEKWYKPDTNRSGIINLIAAIATTSRNNAIKAIKRMYETKRSSLPSEFRNGSTATLDQLHELSRCSPDSLEDFRKVMQKQAGAIFSPAAKGEKYTGDTFVRRLQLVIQSDRPSQRSGLHEQCQHMLRLSN